MPDATSPSRPTALNQYRPLGRSGLLVSPLCLGTMTFGEDWGWGGSKDDSRAILDAYAERGGNFLDTANLYTNGTSESFLGEFLEGRRDQFVLATKFTFNLRPGDPNAGGNSRKSMHQAVEASLKRLRTDYIDLYWVHLWDQRTPVEETMRGLDELIRAGKVLYVGVSDMPAWKVAQSNVLAELRGLSPYVGLQIEYSLLERTVERDLIPMAIELGLGVTPWSPLGGGVLTGKYSRGRENEPKRYSGDFGWTEHYVNDRNLKIADELGKIAKDVGRSPAQVAIAWLLHQSGVTSVIIGARKMSQLTDNLGALEINLTPDQLSRLDEISRVALGFPHEFFKNEFVQKMLTGGTTVIQ
jgi:aryl-alcohol dehydrogenase-like predicted oxidoreductase